MNSNEKRITIGLEMKLDDSDYKSILYTDGKNDIWLSRRFHEFKHLKGNNYLVFIDRWLAEKKGII